ncbi:MAG: putative DNA binding domain-containing protein [Candidatus Accumulibacter sp.]|jgi:ATP-dependent DNA helicase RecG|nr:putative DNA binding domain-containing protein [Accumulibacter sp.]
MKASEHRIQTLIAQGEGISLEFKTCRDQLNRDVYETVCAFLNRHGGILLLGVNDAGKITGIAPEALEHIRKDFVTAVNNPQKLSPPTYLSLDAVMVNGKNVLVVHVPESSQVHRCNGRIYDRNEDGDFDITDSTSQVAPLYLRKQTSFSENRVYAHIQPGDLRADLIERCRRYVRINRKNHPWTDMDDEQLLKSAQLAQIDPETRKSGVTLAGVMLFGTDAQILQVCPPHRTDCILRKVDVDRYDDRDLIRTNLLDSYDRILAFIQKHLPDPFHLEGMERRSLRDAIFREVASNILIHREYAGGVPARLIIERGKVTTYNANRPHGFGLLDPETSVPYPKNPVLGAFFREIDRADELGSGMRKMMLYGKKYGGADPRLMEGDVFRMIISVPEFDSVPSRDQVGTKSGPSRDQVEVLHMCMQEKTITELMRFAGRSSRTKFRDQVLKPLLESGRLEMTIPDKPTSSRQKYRTTAEGGKIVAGTGGMAGV